jgi:hypothetical protein
MSGGKSALAEQDFYTTQKWIRHRLALLCDGEKSDNRYSDLGLFIANSIKSLTLNAPSRDR